MHDRLIFTGCYIDCMDKRLASLVVLIMEPHGRSERERERERERKREYMHERECALVCVCACASAHVRVHVHVHDAHTMRANLCAYACIISAEAGGNCQDACA